jgi:hypothetical protein
MPEQIREMRWLKPKTHRAGFGSWSGLQTVICVTLPSPDYVPIKRRKMSVEKVRLAG